MAIANHCASEIINKIMVGLGTLIRIWLSTNAINNASPQVFDISTDI